MFDKIVKNISDVAGDLNPVARNITKKDKKIIDCLVSNGFSKEEIASFVDVYQSDVEKYVDKLYSKLLKKASETAA